MLPRKLFDRFSVLHIITQLLFAIFFVLSCWDGDYIVVVNCIIIMYHGLWIFVYFVYFVVWEIACIRVHSWFRGMPRKRRRRGCSWSEGGGRNHEKTRMYTNVILPWTGYAICQHVSGLWIFVYFVYFVVQGFNSHLLRLHFVKRRSPPVAILLIRVASRLVRGVLRRRLGHPACGPLA